MRYLAWGVALLATACLLPAIVEAADESPAIRSDAWPREFTSAEGDRLTVHQPQVDRWENDVLEARVAVALQLAGEDEPLYGALWIVSDTRTNLQTRVVTVGNVRIAEARFPATGTRDPAVVRRHLDTLFPQGPVDISLDRLLANMERTRTQAQVGSAEFGSVLPTVFVEEGDARLVLIDGEPALADIEGTGLLYVVNTDWHILLERGTGTYFLSLGDGWATSPGLLDGTWQRASRPPLGLERIPAGHVRAGAARTPVDATQPVPRIRVCTQPAELVALRGPARFSPIAGTSLLYAIDTQSDLFFHARTSRYYLLASGRWLAAPELRGPWTLFDGDLPEDFARIPASHAKGSVLASVPGTPAAEEAVILAQIPNRAVVQRTSATVDVTYDGEPQFVRCPDAPVAYAANTSYDVVFVEGRYYCCHQGVWFVSPTPRGGWQVCDLVPRVIYTIGPRCPVHRVTYVYVYGSTPDLVTVGYLPGYLGLYVSPRRRVVVFGTGWSYRPWIRAGVWIGWPLTFGVGVTYNPWVSGFVFGVSYYTPIVRRPMRATWYPYTAPYHSRYRTTSAYARWGPSVIHRHDEWLQRSHVMDARGDLSGFGTRRVGTRVPAPTAPAAATRSDLYVGNDGRIYRRSGATWQRREGTTWRSVVSSPPSAPPTGPTRDTPTRTTPRPGTRASPGVVRPPAPVTTPNVRSRLDLDAQARQLGTQRVRQFQTWRRTSPSIQQPVRPAPATPRVVRPPPKVEPPRAPPTQPRDKGKRNRK